MFVITHKKFFHSRHEANYHKHNVYTWLSPKLHKHFIINVSRCLFLNKPRFSWNMLFYIKCKQCDALRLQML